MKPPPLHSTQLNTPLPGPGEGATASEWRATYRRPARGVLLQCELCSVKGTGRLAAGRVTSSTIPTRHGWHLECGGRVEAFDISEATA